MAGNTLYIFIKQQPMCLKESKATADYHDKIETDEWYNFNIV